MRTHFIKATCPKCGKVHRAYLEFKYSGNTPAKFYCKLCMKAISCPKQSAMSNKERGSTVSIRLVDLCKARGLTKEEKKVLDRKTELEARKLRKKLGVKAPFNWWYVGDDYDGEYGGK